jgi:voltage-gated potassium channel
MQALRRRIVSVLEPQRPLSRSARVFAWVLQGLIVLNVLAVILGTVEAIDRRYGLALEAFNVASVLVFTVEYLLRLWTAVELADPRFAGTVRGRLRWATTPLALIDLLAIAPFYLSAFFAIDLRWLRALRLLRILKLTRYWGALGVLAAVFQQEARSIAAGLFVLTVLLVLASSGMFLIEHRVQPEAFGSIPAAMWWAIATLTTVGYGDVTPMTPAGKLFGALVTIIGIGMAALPTAILASGFSSEVNRRRDAFRATAETVLRDGSLSSADQQALLALRQSLGLNESDAEQMLMAAARDSLGVSGEHAEQLLKLARGDAVPRHVTCPHCHRPFEL